MKLDELKLLIRDVPDFPKKDIIFKDISPVLSNADAFRVLTLEMAKRIAVWKPQKIAGIESRGFILAAALAQHMSVGLVLIRKKGKLPWKTVRQSYQLEYGSDEIEMHLDALSVNERVVIVDDVLATGGTALAAVKLCRQLEAQVLGICTMMELEFLNGRKALKNTPVESVFRF